MTNEQKELLIKDLSARLPYGIICEDEYGNVLELNSIDKPNTVTFKCSENTFWTTDLDKCKPYLFPLSSMTIEKKGECPCGWSMIDAWIDGKIYLYEDEELNIDVILNMLEWLNKNHFDYRGLIETGFAKDATGLHIYKK
jgi:hypothetical protein